MLMTIFLNSYPLSLKAVKLALRARGGGGGGGGGGGVGSVKSDVVGRKSRASDIHYPITRFSMLYTGKMIRRENG
jgi:hypothetical protein